jgi:hypothetical protein
LRLPKSRFDFLRRPPGGFLQSTKQSGGTKAAESFPDQAALKAFLASIERPEARALIYESILALAAADSISEEEEPLMVWLHETWKIQ